MGTLHNLVAIETIEDLFGTLYNLASIKAIEDLWGFYTI